MTIIPGQMIPQYENKYFSQIYSNVDDFVSDYDSFNTNFKTNLVFSTLKQENLMTLFALLYAQYGNSPIANSDENQFKFKLFSIILQYGPAWQKRLEIQLELADLSLEDARVGYTNITNHAYNPDTAPSTQSTEELNYINDQNVSKASKSKIDAAKDLWYALRTDVTKEFLKQFEKLFLKVVRPQDTYIFTTDESDMEV